MLKYLIVRACELILLVAVIAGSVYGLSAIAPACGGGVGGGWQAGDDYVVEFQFQFGKRPIPKVKSLMPNPGKKGV